MAGRAGPTKYEHRAPIGLTGWYCRASSVLGIAEELRADAGPYGAKTSIAGELAAAAAVDTASFGDF